MVEKGESVCGVFAWTCPTPGGSAVLPLLGHGVGVIVMQWVASNQPPEQLQEVVGQPQAGLLFTVSGFEGVCVRSKWRLNLFLIVLSCLFMSETTQHRPSLFRNPKAICSPRSQMRHTRSSGRKTLKVSSW